MDSKHPRAGTMTRRTAALAAVAAVMLAVGVAAVLGGSDAPERAPGPSPSGTPATTSPPAVPAQPAPAPDAPVPDTRLAALGGAGPLIGMADNRPETMTDPRFGATGIKRVRVTVPFDDIALGGARLAIQDAWFSAARGQGIEPVVTFFRSSRGKTILPSPEEFRRHFRLFRERYPWVRWFSTWNEANFSAQPTSRDPARTARFYRIARQECSGGRCEVITCDFRPDGRARSDRWLAAFKRGIGPGPHRWGLSSYVDVNRQSTTLTQRFLARTEGPVWVNEVGAINFFGQGFAPDIQRQSRVMAYLLSTYAQVSPRIERIYVYHWRAAAGDDLFDSGLLDVQGVPRPAYYLFFQAIGRPPA
ncbi:MAG TPA: hypothetical protein VFY44_13245 [Thermoleophilaceae bacterium]|nr:hypothetical protein [Thermoleophilaceae bacterium]